MTPARRRKKDRHKDFPQVELMDNVDEDDNSHENMDRGNTGIPANRREYKILTSTFHIGVAEMTPEEQEARAQEELSTGPFRVLTESVRQGFIFNFSVGGEWSPP